MDGKEFEAIRQRLHLRQNELAKVLGVHYVTVNKWERDARAIPNVVGLAMRGLLCEQDRRANRSSGSGGEG